MPNFILDSIVKQKSNNSNAKNYAAKFNSRTDRYIYIFKSWLAVMCEIYGTKASGHRKTPGRRQSRQVLWRPDARFILDSASSQTIVYNKNCKVWYQHQLQTVLVFQLLTLCHSQTYSWSSGNGDVDFYYDTSPFCRYMAGCDTYLPKTIWLHVNCVHFFQGIRKYGGARYVGEIKPCKEMI